MTNWTTADIPDQSGRTVLITGANSGLGLHSATTLASRGAKVLLACRSAERGKTALADVAAHARTEPELVELDLADLHSVRRAASQVRDSTGDQLDVLMNNAGVMATPHQQTKDGFELQVGTNHLGHAALTWLLMPALHDRPGARVVTLSSIAHLNGQLDLDDLHFRRRRYAPAQAYAQSKLANLLFTLELDRLARRAELDLVSVAAHPGMTQTELTTNMARSHGLPQALNPVARVLTKTVAQSTAQGALPQLYAATAPDVRGGEYYGPNGFKEIWGHPGRAKRSHAASDAGTAQRLWALTEQLTGVPADPRPATCR